MGHFLVSYFTLIPFMSVINYEVTPVILLMVAGAIFLSGFVIKFKPFYFGGIFTWLMAIVAFLFTQDIQFFATAASAVFGLLIPGYILKNRKD